MPGDECAILSAPGSSEMAHLNYVELGNLSGYFENGNPRPGGGLTQTAPLTHLQNYGYWSGTSHIGQNLAYGFDFIYGVNFANFVGNMFYAAAVTEGDISGSAVPLPAADRWFPPVLQALRASRGGAAHRIVRRRLERLDATA
jgi:hypothetical protein